MNPIVLAVLVVAGVGLVAGLVLAVASVVLAVPRDEKVEAVRDALPGANCGACGFAGCADYAKAIVSGEAEIGRCGYAGYKAGIYACLILFVVTAIGAVPFGYGPVPSGVVLLIWLCMTLGYLKEAVRSGKKKK